MIDGKMTSQPKARRRDCNLSLTVGLDYATRNKCVRLRVQRLRQDEVKFAQLVSTESETGAVFTLDPDVRTTNHLAKPGEWFQRRGKSCQSDAPKPGQPTLELRALCH